MHVETRQDPWADFECRASPPDITACANPYELGSTYVQLLGMYLGDGYLWRAARNVWRLRIVQDARYPRLIAECEEAVRAISGRGVGRVARVGCVEIYGNWKHWLCVFPQHGVGPKHARPIRLNDWQQLLVGRFPRPFIRGLITSDGSRSMNRVHRRRGKEVRQYSYPRYFFTNASADIRRLFQDACDLEGIEHRVMTERVISVARRASVAVLDEFVGPKS